MTHASRLSDLVSRREVRVPQLLRTCCQVVLRDACTVGLTTEGLPDASKMHDAGRHGAHLWTLLSTVDLEAGRQRLQHAASAAGRLGQEQPPKSTPALT